MKKWKKRLSFILAVVMVSSTIAGCGNKETISESGMDLEKLAESSYPISTNEKLTWWSYRGSTVYGGYATPDEMPSMVQYEKETGVDIEWMFATPSQEVQQFNLLLASGDIPDIVSYYWTYNDIPGGPDKAIKDGYFASLNDLIPTYAPAFNKYLEENPVAARDLRTDGGNYFYIPSYATSEEESKTLISSGYMFRKDWLDELNLPVPETIDDWYITLKAFKEKKNASAPLSMPYSWISRGLTGAWGLSLPTYKEGDTVKYGYAEPAYKEFLLTMNKWYNEGLLDKSFASIDAKSVNAKIINGEAGAGFGWANGELYRWTKAARENNPEFELVGVPFPVMNKGEISAYALRDPMVYFGGCAIGQNSKNKELAVKLLDYGFTEKGREQLRFGIENETFVIENNNFKYTDKIEANADGLDKSQAINMYIRNDNNIPVLNANAGLRANVIETFTLPEMQEAVNTWRNNEGDKTRLPTTLAPAVEHASEYGRILTDLNKYSAEMMLKFIVGDTPFSEYDTYLEELEKRGLSRLLEILQEAYDNYKNR